MAVNYQELPFYTLFDSVSEKSKERHYEHLTAQFHTGGLSQIQFFHTGEFQLSGVNHLMAEFLTSEDAKKNLNYPQGFLIMEASPNYYTNRTDLQSYELRYTLDGEGFLQYRGKKYIIGKGEGYFIDCREPHLYRTNSDSWTSTIFHINGATVGHIFRQYAAGGNVKFTEKNCPNFEMLQFQVLKNSQKILPYKDYKLSCLIDILLTELLTSRAEGFCIDAEPEIVPQIITYLQDNYMNDITLEMLMSSYGISRNTLCREFKNYTGFTVKKYLITLRIHQAKLLLQGSLASVDEIASDVGFHDTSHFIQIFKKEVGVTPLGYRKQFMK